MSETTSTEQQFQLPVPGEKHALLKPFEGTFRAEVKITMGPGEPQVSTGLMKSSFQLNGLFLRQEYKGDATDGPIPSFEGQGYWGYNSVKNQFEGFWIDIASDQFQCESGQVDEAGKVWEMHSEVTCPNTGVMKKRTLITLVDENNHSMESYFTMGDNPESKVMEINYTRA